MFKIAYIKIRYLIYIIIFILKKYLSCRREEDTSGRVVSRDSRKVWQVLKGNMLLTGIIMRQL